MNAKDFHVHLVISTNSSTVCATLAFINNGREPFAIETYHLCSTGKMEKELFEVTDREGDEVQYLGKTVKRRAPREEDFVLVPPGGRVTSSIRLDRYYDLSKSGTYSARYSVIVSTPGEDDLIELESEEVTFQV